MKWIILALLLTGCATKNISFETEIVMPVRPQQLAGVTAFETNNTICMSPEDFAKTFEYITDIENYADKLEILLNSVTKEIK